jgi:hypothetical protein
MANLTREQILARKQGHEVFDLPDGSGSVVVRGLNRREALHVAEIDDLRERDAFLIAAGLIDPALSPDDVLAWGDVDDTNTLEAVSRKIGELSGMVEGAGKSSVPSPRRRSRS